MTIDSGAAAVGLVFGNAASSNAAGAPTIPPIARPPMPFVAKAVVAILPQTFSA